MKKKYELSEENDDANSVNEPVPATCGNDTEIMILPALTEEELKDYMTGEEFVEYWCKCIDEVFGE